MPPMDIVAHHNMPDTLQDLIIPAMEAQAQNLRLVSVNLAPKMVVQTKLHIRDLAAPLDMVEKPPMENLNLAMEIVGLSLDMEDLHLSLAQLLSKLQGI